ncbi:MAG: porin family protein [Chlamydiales bacterium]|nr:porin family protein [Chlamydiales bacterium]
MCRFIFLFVSSLLLISPLFAFSSCCYENSGIYVGLEGGYGWQDFRSGRPWTTSFDDFVITKVSTKKSNGGAAGRIFVGFSSSRGLGLEAGAAFFSDLNWEITTFFEAGNLSSVKMTAETYALDLLIRGTYRPFEWLTLFGKAGLAYVNTELYFSTGISDKKEAFRPELAAGMAFPFSNCLFAEVTYSHIFWSGDLHRDHHTPSLDSILVGVIYRPKLMRSRY